MRAITEMERTCYRGTRDTGPIYPEDGWIACEDYTGLCCLSGDQCLEEQFCHNAFTATPGHSGYYVGLCTDSSYEDPSCSSRCTSFNHGDAVYNYTSNLWTCCGEDYLCDAPTNTTFAAPPPEQLLAAASSITSASSMASTAVPGATVTVTATPSAIVEHTSSLSTGAKAGIGVCAALAAIATIGLIVCLVLLRKRMSSRQQGQVIPGGMPQGAPSNAANVSEMASYSRPHELGVK